MQKQILVIQTAFVGDLLLSIPLLKRLKTLHGDVKIDIVCRKGLGSLLQNLGLIRNYFEIDKTSKAIDAGVFDEAYDLLISPHQSFRSAKISKKAKAKVKIGYFKWWNFWAFDSRVKRPMDYPEVLRQMALLQDQDKEVREFFRENKTEWRFMSDEKMPSWASMELDLEVDINEKWKTIFEKPVCFLAPGSVWNTKRWTVEGFSSVAKHFKKKGMNVCLVGAPSEKEIADQVAKEVSDCVNLCGDTTLLDMYALFKRGKFIVCNDSGAMHMAAVAGLPTVSVFGPTTLELGYRPWQEFAKVVELDLNCRPCGLHGAEKCPIGTHACMKELESSKVIEAVMALGLIDSPSH